MESSSQRRAQEKLVGSSSPVNCAVDFLTQYLRLTVHASKFKDNFFAIPISFFKRRSGMILVFTPEVLILTMSKKNLKC